MVHEAEGKERYLSATQPQEGSRKVTHFGGLKKEDKQIQFEDHYIKQHPYLRNTHKHSMKKWNAAK